MQLMLVFGIAFAIGAVMFALQNNVPVTVTLAVWRFDSSLAMVLLLALGLGAIIAGLLSSPTVIRGQWTASRLRRQVSSLEEDKAKLERRIREMEATSPAPRPGVEESKLNVGLKRLLTGGEIEKPKEDGSPR